MDILDEFGKEFEFENDFRDFGAEVLAEYTKSSGDEDSVDGLFEGNIKMEFSCESEQVMEPHMTKESFDDSHHTETTEIDDHCIEEEICSIGTGQSDYELIAAAENCGIDVTTYKSYKNNVNNSDDTDVVSDISENHDDDKLSNVMSDHNYMSQEAITGDSIRQNLINHFKRRITDKYEHLPNNITIRTKKIVNFVNNLMERIDNFNMIKSEDDLTEEDLFVQNFLDAVAAEDAAEENDRDNVTSESQTASPSPLTNKRSVNNNETVDSTLSEAESSKLDLPPPPPPPPPLQPSKPSSSSDYDKQSAINDELLPENCSEPLEHADVVFDVVDKTQPAAVLPLLDDLSKFAKMLSEDCENFRISPLFTEQTLTDYVKLQLKQFQQFANIHSVTLGVQTESESHQHLQKMSKRKSRKLNMLNKMALLATSESDTCSDTELTSDPEVEVNHQTMKDDTRQNDNNLSASTSAEVTLNNGVSKSCNEYDDGISLAKYVQSEIFETQLYERSSSSSDEECHQPSLGNKEDNKNENQKKCASNDESDKENDKEIERLINLNGLASRRNNNNGIGAVKNADGNLIEKPKTKALTQKSRSDELLNFMDDHESDREVASDENVNESDEEITEQTYLKRYNEEYKMQLLNSSSSEDGDSDYDTVADIDKMDNRSNDVDNDDSKGSPTLDKFLKDFDADAELDSEDDENDESKDKEQTTVAPSETAIKADSSNVECIKDDTIPVDRQVTSPNELVEATEKSNLSTDNSDCELLTDNFNFRKRESKPKSLEKLIKDADKRRKTNSLLVDDELISLSSASDGTDVEAVDAEVEESSKSRIIKPMLRQDQLAGETRKAQKNEEERIRRLEKKQSQLTKALKEQAKEYQKGDLILDYNEEKKTFIKVHSDIVKHMKEHQIEGVKFLYDSCYGGLEALKKSGGSGCILAHCMGLGKTLQLIALLHTVISYRELKTTKVLVLCPKSTVMNWADEIVRWIGHISMKNLKVYKFSDTSDINEKISVLKEWSQSTANKAGCLLIGYEAFRRLVFFHSYKSRGNTSSSVLEDIRDKVVKYLLKPGADLVVCDEGHIIKNRKSAISLAVAEIVTPKRIILTGTPIQNNLKEYYSMVNFIKPLFLGTEKEFANLYANPIRNGQHKDSSKKDIKIMKQRSFVLHKKLSKFVQRKEAELLKSFLPQKFEYVLFIPLTEVQNNLYEYILSAIPQREENRGRGLITDYTCLRKIWTHPKVLEMAWKNAINQKYKRDVRKNPNPNSDDDQPDDIYDSQTGVMSVTNDWWRHLVTDNDLESIMPSNKLRTMFEIIRMCSEKDEKCLIFSAFVAVLNVVEYFFKKITDEDPETLKELNIVGNNRGKNTWISGKDYYRLDGKTSKSIRHEMVQRFNAAENKRARVFLISAKAGGQGINLTGANRVIILDTSWNPSNDQQNIFRIFRLGQKRNCYIYRLLAMSTMEEKVYSRSVTKQAMSFRVVDEQQIDRHYSMAELTELYTLTKPDYAQREVPVLPQDSVLISLLRNYPQMVYKYHEHDSLLENKVEQELSEQEKADAWNAYERDLQLSTELREMPNLDLLQQNFGPAKMPNFLGTYPGPDMSALFNYGMGQQPPAPSAMPTPHYNPYSNPFSSTGNSYMDMLNLYRKYTQPSFAYPEISKSLRDNFNPSVFNAAQLNPSALLGAAAAGGGPSPPSAASNPLSALGDMSIYPMMSKALPPPLSTGSSGVGVGGSGPGSLFPVHLAPTSNPFEQYNKALSVYQNLYANYSDYQQASNAAAAKNKYDASPFLPPAPAPLPSAPPPYQPQPQPPALPPISPQLPHTASMKTTTNNLNSISGSNSHNNNNNNNNSNSNNNSSNHPTSSRENSGSSRTDSAYHQSSRASSSLLPSTTSAVSTPTATSATSSAPPPAPAPASSASTSAPAPISQPINMHANADSGMVLSKLPPKLSNAVPPMQSAGFGNAAKGHQSSASQSKVGGNRGTPPQAPAPSQSASKPPSVARNSSNVHQPTTQQFPTKATSAVLPPNRSNAVNAVSNKPNAPNAPPSMGKSALQSPSNNAMVAASKLSVSQKRVHLTGKPGSPTPNITALARSLLKASSAVTSTSAAAPATATASSSIAATVSPTVTGAAPSRPPPQAASNAGKTKQHTASGSGAMTITPTSAAPNNNNMGIVYPTNASTVQRIGKADVQIIPTTTAQATPVSASKPFGDISPSISLTALRNTTPNATANSNNSNNNSNSGSSKQLTAATIKQISNTSKPGATSGSLSNLLAQQPKPMNSSSSSSTNNNNSGKMNPSSSSLSINKFIKKLPAQLHPPHRAASASTSASASSSNVASAMTTTASPASASASAKMAAATSVLAKANSAAAFQSYYKQVDAKQQRRTASPIKSPQAAAAATAAAAIKRNSLSGNSGGAPVIRRIKEGSGVRSPLTINAVTTANTSSSPGSFVLGGGMNLKIVPKTAITNQTSQATSSSSSGGGGGGGGGGGNVGGVTVQKRTTATLSAASASSTTSSSSAATATAATTATANNGNKNALNIRTIDGKPNSGVYIIETNINEKRVAIGAATKSGGGTTVTKVLPGIKRKAAADIAPSNQNQLHTNSTSASATGTGSGAAALAEAAFNNDAPKRVKMSTAGVMRLKLN